MCGPLPQLVCDGCRQHPHCALCHVHQYECRPAMPWDTHSPRALLATWARRCSRKALRVGSSSDTWVVSTVSLQGPARRLQQQAAAITHRQAGSERQFNTHTEKFQHTLKNLDRALMHVGFPCSNSTLHLHTDHCVASTKDLAQAAGPANSMGTVRVEPAVAERATALIGLQDRAATRKPGERTCLLEPAGPACKGSLEHPVTHEGPHICYTQRASRDVFGLVDCCCCRALC